jgi:hypothetical protein
MPLEPRRKPQGTRAGRFRLPCSGQRRVAHGAPWRADGDPSERQWAPEGHPAPTAASAGDRKCHPLDGADCVPRETVHPPVATRGKFETLRQHLVRDFESPQIGGKPAAARAVWKTRKHVTAGGSWRWASRRESPSNIQIASCPWVPTLVLPAAVVEPVLSEGAAVDGNAAAELLSLSKTSSGTN